MSSFIVTDPDNVLIDDTNTVGINGAVYTWQYLIVICVAGFGCAMNLFFGVWHLYLVKARVFPFHYQDVKLAILYHVALMCLVSASFFGKSYLAESASVDGKVYDVYLWLPSCGGFALMTFGLQFILAVFVATIFRVYVRIYVGTMLKTPSSKMMDFRRRYRLFSFLTKTPRRFRIVTHKYIGIAYVTLSCLAHGLISLYSWAVIPAQTELTGVCLTSGPADIINIITSFFVGVPFIIATWKFAGTSDAFDVKRGLLPTLVGGAIAISSWAIVYLLKRLVLPAVLVPARTNGAVEQLSYDGLYACLLTVTNGILPVIGKFVILCTKKNRELNRARARHGQQGTDMESGSNVVELIITSKHTSELFMKLAIEEYCAENATFAELAIELRTLLGKSDYAKAQKKVREICDFYVDFNVKYEINVSHAARVAYIDAKNAFMEVQNGDKTFDTVVENMRTVNGNLLKEVLKLLYSTYLRFTRSDVYKEVQRAFEQETGEMAAMEMMDLSDSNSATYKTKLASTATSYAHKNRGGNSYSSGAVSSHNNDGKSRLDDSIHSDIDTKHMSSVTSEIVSMHDDDKTLPSTAEDILDIALVAEAVSV